MDLDSVLGSDGLDATKCDGIELTRDLFKDHKMSVDTTDDQKRERIQTYLRIRALPNSEANNRNEYFQVIDDKTLVVIPPKGSNAHKFSSDAERKQFNFTKIFDEKVDQNSIYESFALPVVRRFLCGQNCLLFSYGITSSGKTYTMRGTTTNPGVIPRALNTIFEVIGHKMMKGRPTLKPDSFTDCIALREEERELEESVGKYVFSQTDGSYELNSFRSQIALINETEGSLVWNDVLQSTFRASESNIVCSVWISFYEIYNETIYDLLELDVSGEKKQKIMLLKDNESDDYFVKGLRQICVSSAEEAYKVLVFGKNNLHISATSLNKNSSRSHSVFNISLVRTNSGKRSVVSINHLSICDLAGAERSEKANNTGKRIKEAGKINGSLLSLSRCISALRQNQKFESKKRFVNFRDSKLTKVFQPFLSGSGMAAMISNMNPALNLFDETLFALKFTGVAAQVVVSSEDQRNKFQESVRRLTQLWMQSSERWSLFAHQKAVKPSISVIQTIAEEDEDENEPDVRCLNLTVEELEEKVNAMDLSRADPQEMEVLRTQIDFLIEKLQQTENEKFEMELEVRQQVVAEFNKLITEMEAIADDKDRAKKKLEQMMTQRLVTNENRHRKEREEFESKINSIETEKFEIHEELCRQKEANERALTRVAELESLLSLKLIEKESKRLNDVNTSPIRMQSNDANTSTVSLHLKDANNSAINLLEFKDSNTSAIDMECESGHQMIESSDKGIGTSFVELIDTETSTSYVSNEMCDKNTSASVESTNKSTSVDTNCLDLFRNKETITECLTSSEATIKADKSISTVEVLYKDVSTSPVASIKPQKSSHSSSSSPILHFNEDFVSKEKFNQLVNDLKEKEAMIAYNRRIVEQRDQSLKSLEEENSQLKANAGLNWEQLLKKPRVQTSSTASSIASSISSMPSVKSIKSEDVTSVSSLESIPEKPKKSSKYSSRKRKPNLNNSIDKRYLHSVSDALETTLEEKSSQNSVVSVESSTIADEIGNDVYSTKKRSNRKISKRKMNYNMNENEYKELNRAPESKRKRPPLERLCSSPISPIPTDTRVTRARAKKSLNF